MQNIDSQTATDIGQIMSGKFCSNCKHELSEHEFNKCYGLDYDGIWKACTCVRFKTSIQIRFTIDEYEFLIPKNSNEENKEINTIPNRA